jgi:hypothetical protein
MAGVEARFAPPPARAEQAPNVRVAPPLPDIPLPAERHVSPELVETAHHELNHALTARHLGIGVESISVVREGNVLGKTILSGGDPRKLGIVAAAGGVHTTEGPAQGHGSDDVKATMVAYFHGGESLGRARVIASSFIQSYSAPLRRKISELIAYKGKVEGSMLSDIIKRAEYEISLETGKPVEVSASRFAPYPLEAREITISSSSGPKLTHMTILVDRTGRQEDKYLLEPARPEEEQPEAKKPEEKTPEKPTEYVVFDPKEHGKQGEPSLN